MAVSPRLKAWLDGSKVKYAVTKHALAYTAQEIAASQHVSGRQLAKCVLVNTDRGPVLAVLPAVVLIDLKKLKAALHAKTLTIAKEADIKQRFPDIEVGAMSPFGNLYEVPVVVDRALEVAEEIVFNAGSHTETITMRYRHLAQLVKPRVANFGQPVGGRHTAKRARGAKKPVKRSRTAAGRRSRPKRPITRRRSRRR